MYAFTLSRGDDGVTDDEIKTALDLTQNTVARSRKRLADIGAMYRTDTKRKTSKGWPACVWRATPDVDVVRPIGRPSKTNEPRDQRLTVYMNEKERSKLDRLAGTFDTPTSRLATSLMGIGYTATNNGIDLTKWAEKSDNQ